MLCVSLLSENVEWFDPCIYLCALVSSQNFDLILN